MTSTPKKHTALARTREESKAIRSAQEAAPLTFVIPPVAELLGTIQAVAGNELRAMLKDQQVDGDRRLSNDDAKKLATLTDAVVKATNAANDLSDEEMGKLSDDDVEVELVAELERIRAKKGST